MEAATAMHCFIMRSFELIEVDLSEFGFVETPWASCWLRVFFLVTFKPCFLCKMIATKLPYFDVTCVP